MNRATLIKKELLPNNFKLTFKNQESTRFLILHEEHKELYNQLELSQEYFYTWKKGKSNYCFINPHSIRKNIEKTPNKKPTQQATYQRNFFIQQLFKDLKIKTSTEEEFLAKIEHLKGRFKRITQSDNLKFTFEWVKEFITTLYLKHEKLKKAQHIYTEQEKKEQDFLTEIGVLFLHEWIYCQDQRESGYNQHYYLKKTEAK